ncbi:MAG: T9SS type A sorting domain-containing protein [Chitinophagales bacterium]
MERFDFRGIFAYYLKLKDMDMRCFHIPYLLIVFLFYSNSLFAQQPSNDSCAYAINLPVIDSCNFDYYFSTNATTETGVAPNPTCGFYSGGDVWFTATMPASGALRIEIENITGNNQAAIYTGVCGNMEQITCLQLDVDRTVYRPGLAGATIYVRMYGYNSSSGGEFNLCLWEPVIPVNNDCANAIAINVGDSCSLEAFTNAYSTPDSSGTAPNPSCGFYKGSDVWFKFEMPLSGVLRVEKNNLTTNAQIAVYSGVCGTMTQEFCMQLDNNRTYINQALAGDTLYMRVYTYNSEEGGTFEVCAWEPTPPVNNFCANAVALNVGDSCSYRRFTNAYATADSAGTAPNPSCGFYKGGDVWFKFEMPLSGELRVEKNNVSANAQMQIYSGVCGNFVNVECIQLDAGRTYINPDLAGDSLYMRVFNYNSEEGGEFDICLWDPDVPVNNSCGNALPLTVRDTCIPEVFTNAYATADSAGTAPSPGCGFYKGGDVWFTIDVPVSGIINLRRTNIAGVNAQFALYSGTCGNFNLLACAQLTNKMNIEDTAIAGEKVYLRVFNYNSQEGGEFSLCVYDTTCITLYEYIDTSICMGESFTIGNSVYTNAGIYRDTFLTDRGCDSIIRTNLQVLSVLITNLTPQICDGDSFYVANSVYSSSGNYADTLTANNGCDSIINTTLTVLPYFTTTIDTAICSGLSFRVGTNNYSSSGNYSDTLQADNGCDSIVNTNLTILPHAFTQIDTAICAGESFTVGNSTYSSAGNYTDTLTAANGCDSIVNTNLTILPHAFTQIDTAICAGESFTVGNSTYSSAGNYTDTLTAANGCDSIVNTVLMVESIDKPSVLLQGDTLFTDSGYATYQWIDCDANGMSINGAKSRYYIPPKAGNYAVVAENDIACNDTSDCFIFNPVGVDELILNSDLKIYPNPFTAQLILENKSNEALHYILTNMLGQNLQNGVLNPGKLVISTEQVPAGIYFLSILKKDGRLLEIQKLLNKNSFSE